MVEGKRDRCKNNTTQYKDMLIRKCAQKGKRQSTDFIKMKSKKKEVI